MHLYLIEMATRLPNTPRQKRCKASSGLQVVELGQSTFRCETHSPGRRTIEERLQFLECTFPSQISSVAEDTSIRPAGLLRQGNVLTNRWMRCNPMMESAFCDTCIDHVSTSLE